MALTVTEAIAVQTVLRRKVRHAFHDREDGCGRGPLDDQVENAYALLADAAHKKLGAGPTGADVRKAWGTR